MLRGSHAHDTIPLGDEFAEIRERRLPSASTRHSLARHNQGGGRYRNSVRRVKSDPVKSDSRAPQEVTKKRARTGQLRTKQREIRGTPYLPAPEPPIL